MFVVNSPVKLLIFIKLGNRYFSWAVSSGTFDLTLIL